MPPKKKKPPPKVRCDETHGEKFSAPTQDVTSHNWWEVFCFPYILCGRIWDCLVTMCAGTNQCLVYWMVIQWIVCKITRLTTPGPIIFPYYFYVFCQVLMATVFFIVLWIFFGKSIVIPYFQAFYYALAEINPPRPVNGSRLSLRRYCFRKSELFDTPVSSTVSLYNPKYCYFLAVATHLLTDFVK